MPASKLWAGISQTSSHFDRRGVAVRGAQLGGWASIPWPVGGRSRYKVAGRSRDLQLVGRWSLRAVRARRLPCATWYVELRVEAQDSLFLGCIGMRWVGMGPRSQRSL